MKNFFCVMKIFFVHNKKHASAPQKTHIRKKEKNRR